MFRSSPRLRAAVVGASLAVVLAACGSTAPNEVKPDPGPDLFEALPAQTTTAVPTPTATSTPKPTPTKTPPKVAGPAGAHGVAKPQGSPGGTDPGLGGWRLVNSDEFNDDTVDPAAWMLYDSVGGFGTGYRKPKAITESGGQLHITAKKDVSGGMGSKFGQLYGRWEFRAKTTPGRGFGSAVLLWPDSEQWPADGEIDIMEVPGEKRDLAHFVLHWSEANLMHGNAIPGDFAQWHTFVVEWLPDRVTWYVDGVKQYENTDKAAIPTKPMHITVQLDQGPKAGWIEARDDTTPDEVSLDVDWVRVYAR